MTTTLQVTREDVLERVRALLPVVASQVEAGEQERRLPAATAQAYVDAGLPRILVPRAFGGFELGLDTWFDVVEAIAEVDAAQAWCASLMIHDVHYLAQFPIEAQEAVWADGADVCITTSLAPATTVEAVDGGYRLTGEASWGSGIGNSTWAMVGGFLPVAGPPQPALFLVPEAAYTVRDVWQTTGMRATGSNVIVTDGAFVPSTHMIALADLLNGTGPGGAVHSGAIYRSALVTYAPLTFVVPMLGAAKGALELFRTWATPRASRKNANVNNTSTQIRMGRAAADIDAAELLLRRGMAVAEQDELPSLDVRARCMRDYARGGELLLGAVNDLLALSGTSGFFLDSQLQKHWRDVNFAARHQTLKSDNIFAHWSSTQFGLPRNPAEMTEY